MKSICPKFLKDIAKPYSSYWDLDWGDHIMLQWGDSIEVWLWMMGKNDG